MDLAIRVNVRYAAPSNSRIKDVLRLFKSPRWVQSIIRHIMPRLHGVAPTAGHVIDAIKQTSYHVKDAKDECCVICMELMQIQDCVKLPCRHIFHTACIEPWLRTHSTCPICREQLPTDKHLNYSVYAINTTIILRQSQARLPTHELLEESASNQIIRAVVNARVRRNTSSTPSLTSMTDNRIPQDRQLIVRNNLTSNVNTCGDTTRRRQSLILQTESSLMDDNNRLAIESIVLPDPPVNNLSVLQRIEPSFRNRPPIVPVIERNAIRRRCESIDSITPLRKHKRRRQNPTEPSNQNLSNLI